MNSKEHRRTNGHWCKVCDMAIVSDGQKCPVCRALAGGKKKLPYRDLKKIKEEI